MARTAREIGPKAIPPARPETESQERYRPAQDVGATAEQTTLTTDGASRSAQEVKQDSEKQYLRERNELLHRVNLTAEQARVHSGIDLDSIIVKHFEKLFFQGEQRTRGMKLLGGGSFSAEILSSG